MAQRTGPGASAGTARRRTACAHPGAGRARTRQRGDATPPLECPQQHAAHASRECRCCVLR
eukprot:5418606-Pleurochrysis_carterae.AAC.1